MNLIIDGDAIAFKSAFSPSPARTAIRRIWELVNQFDAGRAIIAIKGEGECFRKELWPAYKSNRKPKDPMIDEGIRSIVSAFHAEFVVKSIPTLEADDVVGIVATLPAFAGNSVIVSNDKDFKQIPGRHHNFAKDSPGKVTEIDAEQADTFHLMQTLIGDSSVDCYPGCPGIGDAKAAKILAKRLTPQTRWKGVVSAFIAAKKTEADALLQARVAKILRCDDFDFETMRPKLWEPKKEVVML